MSETGLADQTRPCRWEPRCWNIFNRYRWSERGLRTGRQDTIIARRRSRDATHRRSLSAMSFWSVSRSADRASYACERWQINCEGALSPLSPSFISAEYFVPHPRSTHAVCSAPHPTVTNLGAANVARQYLRDSCRSWQACALCSTA